MIEKIEIIWLRFEECFRDQTRPHLMLRRAPYSLGWDIKPSQCSGAVACLAESLFSDKDPWAYTTQGTEVVLPLHAYRTVGPGVEWALLSGLEVGFRSSLRLPEQFRERATELYLALAKPELIENTWRFPLGIAVYCPE